MTFSQYFDYHSSLKPKWKEYYVSYKELRQQVKTLKQLLIHNLEQSKQSQSQSSSSATDRVIDEGRTVDHVRILSMIKSLHITIMSRDNDHDKDDAEIQQCAQTFFDMLYSDVQSVLQFYNESILESEQMLRQLERKVREENWQVRREMKSRARRNLQTEMVSLYRRLYVIRAQHTFAFFFFLFACFACNSCDFLLLAKYNSSHGVVFHFVVLVGACWSLLCLFLFM